MHCKDILRFFVIVVAMTFVEAFSGRQLIQRCQPLSWSRVQQSSIRGEYVDSAGTQDNLKRVGQALGKAMSSSSRSNRGSRTAELNRESAKAPLAAAVAADGLSPSRDSGVHPSEFVHTVSSWKNKRSWKKKSARRYGASANTGSVHWQLYVAAQEALQESGDKLHFTTQDIVLEDKSGHFKAIQRIGCSNDACVRHFDHHSEMVPGQRAEAQQFARLERDLYRSIQGISGRAKPSERM